MKEELHYKSLEHAKLVRIFIHIIMIKTVPIIKKLAYSGSHEMSSQRSLYDKILSNNTICQEGTEVTDLILSSYLDALSLYKTQQLAACSTRICSILKELASPVRGVLSLKDLLLRLALLTLNAKVNLKLAHEADSTCLKIRLAAVSIFESERAFKLALSIAAQASNCITSDLQEEESKKAAKTREILIPKKMAEFL